MTPGQVEIAVEAIGRAVATINAQKQELDVARVRIAALEGKVELLTRYAVAAENHNAECKAICNSGLNCGYEGYLKRTGRRCPECPMRSVIDPMPHKGTA